MLWFSVRVNTERIATVEIQRRERLDLGDPAALDTVSTYDVRLDGVPVGTVSHRYGDGWARLTALATGLIADRQTRLVSGEAHG